ncbi:N-acetyltransferase domain-containing protein [Fusarium sp. LHS14.1]|nr:N-acetyltransferase domain-containing protein [Fusarium sp. LHS14.1]
MSQSHMRIAEAKDVDQVTQVFIKAMQDNQSWPYRFPHRVEYAEDHWNYNRDLILELQDAAQAWQIVAFSVWDTSYVNKRAHGPGYIPNSPQQDTREVGYSRRDTDPKHLAAFQAALKESNQKYLSQFGSNQIKLQVLGTLPEYRRQGFASQLCRWGMERAARDRVAMTLSASPQGYPLYAGLGFRKLGQQVINAPGEEESLVVDCMAFEPEQ